MKLEKMVDIMSHRGPDEKGLWIEGEIALGHSRLSIIDLKGGQQPMSDSNGNVIIFNGEIYNYEELRRELISRGFVFKTASDTEVLLSAYECWAEGCLDKLVGMFGFAIWNARKKELFFARDRLGKKPLYYYQSESLFAFASELKSLLTLEEVMKSVEINPYSLSDYLSLGYILAPKTIFKSINKLPAGHYAVYRGGYNDISLHKYWHLEDFFKNEGDGRYDNNMEHDFMELFNDAVKIRMRSDMPLGAFLSGGLDSSSVVSSMSRASNSKIHTFCIGFNEESYDESQYAKIAADYMDVVFQERFYAPLTSKEFSSLIWHFDEPFSDNSFIPTYQLCKFAREYVTVALSGDGADEILAGYSTYLADRFFRIYSLLPVFLQSGLYKLAKSALRPSYRKVSRDYKILQFLKSYGYSPERAHYWWRVIFSEDEKKLIMNPDVLKLCGDYDPFDTFHNYFAEVRHANFLDRSLYVDMKTWLQDDILVKVDRMSMANSLEVRSPFLDHRMVEFVAGIPRDAKMNGGRQKFILKKCMKEYLPKKTLYRSKSGFNTPIQTIKCPPLKESDLLSGKYCLNPDREDITFKFFNLSVLQNWSTMYEHFKITGIWEAVENDA